mgnify:CR=1 FL=1
MLSELTVTIKDDDGKKLSRKFLIHEPYLVDDSDPIIAHHIAMVLKEFQGEPSDINLKITVCIR